MSKTGELVDFTMPSYGAVNYSTPKPTCAMCRSEPFSSSS